MSQQKEVSKEVYKPLNKSEFDERAKLIEASRIQMQMDLYNKVKLKAEEFNQRKAVIDKLQTKITKKVVHQIEEEKSTAKKALENKLEHKMKMKAYSRIIKATKSPVISPKKTEERLQNIHRILISKREPKSLQELPDYLHLKSNMKISKSPSNISIDAEKSLPQIRQLYPDYIKMLREKRETAGKPIKKYDWEKDIRSSSQDKKQKLDNVIMKAKAIEEAAERKEGILKAKGGTAKDIQLGEHISDMWIDAVEAKLALLKQL